MMTSIPAVHFFYGTVIVSLEHLKQSIMSRALCLFHNTYCKHPLNSLWLIREDLTATVFEESNCSSALIKLPIYSTELAAVIFVCPHPILSLSLHKNEVFC